MKTYVTVLRCALAAMLLWVVTPQSHAVTITTTKSEYAPGGARYYFVVSSWGYPGNSSPCSDPRSGFTHCAIILTAQKISTPYYSPVSEYATWDVPVRNNSNMGELLQDLEGKGFRIPLSGSIFVDSTNVSSDLCIGFAYVKIGPNIEGSARTFGNCQPVATLPLQCEITGDTTIDHQVLADNAADGATASTQLKLQCTGPSSMTISTSTTNSHGVRLKDDDSLYSKVTVNGKNSTAGINVPITPGLATPLTITSTLVKRGDLTPGAFLGSTVVTISSP